MKALKIVGITVGVLIAALALFVATFDIGKYKGLMEDRAKAAIGRDVAIGAVKLAPSLTPAITLADVKVANASWGTRADMLAAKRVDVHLDLMPLLHGQVDVSSITVDAPDLWLETDAQGRGNWILSAPAAPESSPASTQDGGGPALAIGRIALKDFTLTYKDASRAATVGAKAASIAFQGPLSALDISKIDMSGVALRLESGDTSADGSIGKLAAEAAGKITDLGITALTLSDAKLAYKAPNQARDLALSRLALGGDGAIDIDGTLDGAAVKIKGMLAPIRRLVALDQPFPAKLSVDALGVKADTDLMVSLTHSRPTVTGRVSISSIALTHRATVSPAASKPSAPPVPGDARVFSNAALPWDSLAAAEAAVDAKVTVDLAKASLPDGLELSQVALPIALTQGKLDVVGFSLGIGGGTLAGSLSASAADKALAVKATGKGMSAETIAKQLKRGDMISAGPSDLQVDIRARGNSERALMASLNGSVLLGIGESRIKTSALNMVGADLFSEFSGLLNTKSTNSGYTNARCAVANFQLANGVATTTNGLVVVTDKMQLTASGRIDLAAERIDLAITPKATGGLGIGFGSLTQAIKISGPLSRPGISLDRTGTVKSLGTLGVAFATGGASVLAQGVKNRIDQSNGADACKAARSGTMKK